MPGFSWKDLKKSKTSTSGEVAPPPIRSLEDAAQLSPMLSRLLAQREKLEAEMQSLSKGQPSVSGTSGRESRIFPVQTLKQRRDELHQWETHRERQKENHLTRIQAAAEKPLGEKLPNKFNQFRDRLTQALPSDTGYEALKDRLLSVEVGSLADIGQRLDQQRQAALEKLIQEREQEAQDALRRERALENYKTRQREQEFTT